MQRESSSPARLLIVDDHVVVREGIRCILGRESDLEVVGEAEDGQEALKRCRQHYPDLVLMDVRMPKMDGFEATRAIKEECPATSVLLMSTYENPDYLLDAIEAGASGYLLKDFTQDELVGATRRVLNGETTLDQDLAFRLLRCVAQGETRRSKDVVPDPAKRPTEPLAHPLTPRELEVLRLLFLGKSNREIGQSLFISPSTVKYRIRRIISKLGVCHRTQAVVRALDLGLVTEREQ